MPTDVAKVKDQLLAEAALNDDAIAAYLAMYPLFDVGGTYLDSLGLTWKIVSVTASNNAVAVLSRYVDDVLGDTNKFRQFYPAAAQMAYVAFNITYPLSTVTAPYDIIFSPPGFDLIYGEILEITIDGGTPLAVGTEYTFNPNTATVTLLVNTTTGQVISILYKKRPYYYGYEIGL